MEFLNACNAKNIIEKIPWDLIWLVTLLSESCVCTVFSVAFNISAIPKQDFNVIKTYRNWNSVMSEHITSTFYNKLTLSCRHFK